MRKASTFNAVRIDHIYQDPHEANTRLFLHNGDSTNLESVAHLMYDIQPEEIYHLGAQSHVHVSFDMPEYSGDVTGQGTRLASPGALRRSGVQARFYQASSSEMFGNATAPQNETTPFQPRSPYAAAGVLANTAVTVPQRESSSGI